MNVTAPFKADIIKYVDEIDSNIKQTENINTIINNNGKLVGTNTDYYGIKKYLNDNKINIKNKTCLIIGAGSTAKTISIITKDAKSVVIVNRKKSKAKKIADEYNYYVGEFTDINEIWFEWADIIFYTIPININDVITHKDNNKKILNINYNFNKSYFGKNLLINQGYYAFKKFFPEYDPYIDFFKHGFNNNIQKNNITLIGYMGAGKSECGKQLAKSIGYTFIDLDVEIEKFSKVSIDKIFESNGEKYFRSTERSRLEKILKKDNQVISCGGGVVLHNKDLLQTTNCVWLYCNLEKSYNRIKGDPRRPLLSDYTAFIELFNKRKRMYLSSSDIIINSDNSILKIVDKIIDEININTN